MLQQKNIHQIPIKFTLARIAKKLSIKKSISRKDYNELKAYDLTTHIYEILDWYSHQKSIPYKTLVVLTDISREQDNIKIWPLILDAILSPYLYDPVNWCPTFSELTLIKALIEYVKELHPQFENAMLEFPLRLLISNMLMSSIFWGIGSENILRWNSEDFYSELLSETSHPVELKKKTNCVEFTRHVFREIAKIFRARGLADIHIGIGAGACYYMPEEFNEQRLLARKAMWKTGLPFELISAFRLKFLAVRGGLIIPGECLEDVSISETPTVMTPVFYLPESLIYQLVYLSLSDIFELYRSYRSRILSMALTEMIADSDKLTLIIRDNNETCDCTLSDQISMIQHLESISCPFPLTYSMLSAMRKEIGIDVIDHILMEIGMPILYTVGEEQAVKFEEEFQSCGLNVAIVSIQDYLERVPFKLVAFACGLYAFIASTTANISRTDALNHRIS